MRLPAAPLLRLVPLFEASRLGISRRHWERICAEGSLGWVAADRYAIRIGSHPAIIWPEWVDLVLDLPDEDRVWRRRQYARQYHHEARRTA